MNQSKLEILISTAIEALQSTHSTYECVEYVSGLLFYKRLSNLPMDIKEREKISIPEIYGWDVLKEEKSNISEALNKATLAIEKENPRLLGLLTNFDDHYWDRFNDGELLKAVDLLCQVDLSGNTLEDIKNIGSAYGHILDISSSNEGFSFLTPKSIKKLMIKMINPHSNSKIYDPACKPGDFLTASVEHVYKTKEGIENLKLFGQTRSQREWRLTSIDLMINGVYDASIKLRDPIIDSAFHSEDESNKFDFILCNPPFNEKLSSDELSHVKRQDMRYFGIPSNGAKNYLFIQHVISSLKDKGRAAMVLPLGILSSIGDEYNIRRQIIESDLIESVIQLAPKLFIGTSIPVVIIVFNKRKKKNNKHKVLFVDASNQYKEERKQNLLQDSDVEKIASAFKEFEDKEGFSRVASIHEISENDYALNVNRYIYYPEAVQLDISLAAANLHRIEDERAYLAEEMDKYLKLLGIES